MFLINWRQKLDHELRTNERGMLPRKAPSVTIPSDFPDLQVLKYYAEPLCSATRNKSGGPIRDNSDLSLPRIAGFCEQYFDEWGHRSMIVKRFRDLLWESALMRVMRRAAIEADLKEKNNRLALRRDDLEIHGPLTPSIEEGVGTPAALVQRYLDPAMVDRIAEAFVNRGPQAGPNDRQNIPDLHPLVVKIVSNRRHVSTDHLLEYRLEIDPHQFVTLTNRGILGSRPDPPINPRPVNEIDNVFQESSQRTQTSPKTPKNAPPDPLSIMRVWLAASIVRQVHPKLVQDYEDAEAAKNAAKAAPSPKKRKGKERAKDDDPMDEDEEPEPTPPRRRPAPRPRPVVPPVTSQVATPPVPRNEETPRSVAPARITETPRVVETPRAMETPRAVETHRTVEHPRHAVHPRLVETPRITMPPPPVKAPLVIEPLRSVAPQRPVESPRSTNPPRPISQPRPEVAPRITEPPRAVQPPLLAEPVQIAEPPRVQLPLQPVPFTNPKDPLEIPVDSESSLPQRLCGFKFTYPNPDNPDYLLSDDEDEESRRPVIYYRKYVPSSSSFTQAAEAGPSNTAKSRYDEIYNRILDVASSSMDLQPTQSGSHHSSTPRASQSRPHAPSPTPASVLPFAPPPLSSAAGPSSYAPIPRTPISRYDAVINEDFGTMDNSGSAKRKETSRKRSRAPTEDEQQEQRHPSGSQGSGKRRRQTKELQVPSNSPPPPTPTPQRILAPFPYIPPLRDLSPSPPLPTFISHSRTNSGRRPIPEDRSIISVHSDDEYPSVASSSQRRRQPIPLDASIISLHSDDDEPGPPTSSLMNPQAQASISSSQPFRSSILQDDDVIIDLT